MIFIDGWGASDRTRAAGAAASRDVRVIVTTVTIASWYFIQAVPYIPHLSHQFFPLLLFEVGRGRG